MSIDFNNTGSYYVKTSPQLPTMASYPCWVHAWVKPNRKINTPDVACVFDSGKTSNFGSTGVSNAGILVYARPRAQTAASSSFSSAISQDALICEPDWD